MLTPREKNSAPSAREALRVPDAGFSGSRPAALRAAFFGISRRIVAPLRGGSDCREDRALSPVARRIVARTWRGFATIRPKRGGAARRQSAAKTRHPENPKIRRPGRAERGRPVVRAAGQRDKRDGRDERDRDKGTPRIQGARRCPPSCLAMRETLRGLRELRVK